MDGENQTAIVVSEEELQQLGISVPTGQERKSDEVTTKTGRKRKSNTNIQHPKPCKLKQLGNEQVTPTIKTKFTSEMDLELLREICVARPFSGKYKEVPGKWEAVKTSLGWSDISALTIRRRFGLLLQKFKSDEASSKQSSGVDEVHDEMIQLLTDIHEFMSSAKDLAEKENSKKEEQAEAVRDAALEGMKISPKTEPNGGGTLRNRNKSNELAAAFESKNKNEFILKEKELEFKKEKFEKLIEQQDKDRLEREENRKIELRRIEALETANRNQHELMMKLFEKIVK